MTPPAPPEAPAKGRLVAEGDVVDPSRDPAALERRAAELMRANEALRRGVEGLSRLDDLNGFLGEMLLAAAGLAGAQSGAVLLSGPGGQTYRFVALLTRDGLVPPETLATHQAAIHPEFRRWLEAMENSPSAWPLAPDSPSHEPAARALRRVPMCVGERLIGWLGLGFAHPTRLLGRLRTMVAALTAGTPLRVKTGQTGMPAILEEQADWAAVKFVQQALTNTLRYAAAETFGLTLAWEAAGLTLTARDDGQGFDPSAPRNGLHAMGERAAECGGFLRVVSAPVGGTALRMFLPFDRPMSPPSS